jgi:hypothetical protein
VCLHRRARMYVGVICFATRRNCCSERAGLLSNCTLAMPQRARGWEPVAGHLGGYQQHLNKQPGVWRTALHCTRRCWNECCFLIRACEGGAGTAGAHAGESLRSLESCAHGGWMTARAARSWVVVAHYLARGSGCSRIGTQNKRAWSRQHGCGTRPRLLEGHAVLRVAQDEWWKVPSTSTSKGSVHGVHGTLLLQPLAALERCA